MSTATLSYEHLYHLSDDVGLFEHAKLLEPRREHGYCVDDVARGLVVAVRDPAPSPALVALAGTYQRFVLDAQSRGRFHNRYAVGVGWVDQPSLADCWGRALWGLGSAVARAPGLAGPALAAFEDGSRHRSPWLRATAFAALGAAEVLAVRPGHAGARKLLGDAATIVLGGGPSRTSVLLATAGQLDAATHGSGWPWPEPRLRYANAVLPEVLIAAGSLLDTPAWTRDGLAMLGWLVDIETSDSHLSVTPAGGWGAGEPRPGFDQQPIEVATLADAAARAYAVTGASRWLEVVRLCRDWFLGVNDTGVPLLDRVTGGGCDGLEPSGANANEGAESTLALLSTLQHADRLLAGSP
jgi:hypothetical protein